MEVNSAFRQNESDLGKSTCVPPRTPCCRSPLYPDFTVGRGDSGKPSGAATGDHDFLRPGAGQVALGRHSNDSRGPAKRLRCRMRLSAVTPGRRRYINSRRAARYGIVMALAVIYVILGVLYEAGFHPLTILLRFAICSRRALLALRLMNNGSHVYCDDRYFAADRYLKRMPS